MRAAQSREAVRFPLPDEANRWHPNGMKFAVILCAMVFLSLLQSCGQPAQTTASETLKRAPAEVKTVDYSSVTEKNEVWSLDGKPLTGVVVSHSADGSKLLRRWEIKEGKMHGLIEEWWENGNKMTETNFVDGKRHGENRYWYMDGQPQKLQVYEHGVSISEEFDPESF